MCNKQKRSQVYRHTLSHIRTYSLIYLSFGHQNEPNSLECSVHRRVLNLHRRMRRAIVTLSIKYSEYTILHGSTAVAGKTFVFLNKCSW